MVKYEAGGAISYELEKWAAGFWGGGGRLGVGGWGRGRGGGGGRLGWGRGWGWGGKSLCPEIALSL